MLQPNESYASIGDPNLSMLYHWLVTLIHNLLFSCTVRTRDVPLKKAVMVDRVVVALHLLRMFRCYQTEFDAIAKDLRANNLESSPSTDVLHHMLSLLLAGDEVTPKLLCRMFYVSTQRWGKKSPWTNNRFNVLPFVMVHSAFAPHCGFVTEESTDDDLHKYAELIVGVYHDMLAKVYNKSAHRSRVATDTETLNWLEASTEQKDVLPRGILSLMDLEIASQDELPRVQECICCFSAIGFNKVRGAVLECHHTMCTGCADRLPKQAGNVVCPSCRKCSAPPVYSRPVLNYYHGPPTKP